MSDRVNYRRATKFLSYYCLLWYFKIHTHTYVHTGALAHTISSCAKFNDNKFPPYDTQIWFLLRKA